MKFLVPIDLAQNELRNARVQNLSSAPANPVAGQVYYNTVIKSLFFHDGTSWIDTKSIDDLGVDDLEDVVITAPSGGEFLVYDSGTSKWINATRDLGDLDDVTVTSATAADVIYWDGAKWVNQALTTNDVSEGDNLYYTDQRADDRIAAASIDDLSDVSLTGTEADGDFLVYNGAAWEDRTVSLDELEAAESDVSLGGNKLTNVGTPTSSSDAATKGYVDNVALGLDVKQSVRVSTTEEITLSGEQTVDGIALSAGDRVLVKNQDSNPEENGIYVVSATAWSRSSDGDAGDLDAGAFVFVEEGTSYADTGWILATDNPITVGTTELEFVQFSGAGTYTAGTGLDLVGSEFSISDGGVDTTQLATGSVTTDKIEDANVTETKLDSTLANKINAKTDQYAVDIGDTVTTSFSISHNFGTKDVQVSVYETGSPYAQVFADVEHTSTNAVTVKFATAPAQDEYRVVVVG